MDATTAPDISTAAANDGVPTNASRYTAAGLIAIAIMLAASFAWAYYSPLTNAVVASGKLISEGFRKPVQHLEGGIVRQVLVKEGDRVEAGATLIQLDETRPSAELFALANRLLSARAQEARFAAEEAQGAKLEFSSELIASARSQNANAVLQDQFELFRTRRQALQERLAALDKRRTQLARQAAALQSEADAASRQLPLAQQELDDYRKLYDQGYGLKNRVFALERSIEQLKGQVARSAADRAEAEAALEATAMEQNQTLKEFVQNAAQKRLESKQEVLEAGERIKVVQDALTRVQIRSPAAGRVFNLRKHGVGAVVAPGEVVLEIVPEAAVLIVETRIDPHDIDRVKAGQAATVRFPSQDRSLVTEVPGTVELVTSDRIEESPAQPSYYVAHVRIDRERSQVLEQLTLRAGVPVEVYIVTGERSALSYIARPLIDNVTRSLRHY